jgi:AcrR family transcriptional regulator
LVGTRGYAALRVDQICSLAGVSTRHFYELYENKEAAFLDLYESLTNESVIAVLESLEKTQDSPLGERVPAAFLAYMDPMFSDLRAARIAFVEVVGLSPKLEEIRLRYRERLILLIEAEGAAGVARGDTTDRDFRFAALALIGSATAIVYDWMVRTDRPNVEHLKQSLADLAVNLLTT